MYIWCQVYRASDDMKTSMTMCAKCALMFICTNQGVITCHWCVMQMYTDRQKDSRSTQAPTHLFSYCDCLLYCLFLVHKQFMGLKENINVMVQCYVKLLWAFKVLRVIKHEIRVMKNKVNILILP